VRLAMEDPKIKRQKRQYQQQKQTVRDELGVPGCHRRLRKQV